MAAKRRHWKEKDGRFWARVSVPIALRPFFDGKTQLTEPLGGNLRVADRNHAAAVARLFEKLENARRSLDPAPSQPAPQVVSRPLTPLDQEHAGWAYYANTLEEDAQKRAAMPTPAEIQAEFDRLMQRIDAGDADVGRNPISMFNVYTDYELKAGARHFDEKNRGRRLVALRAALTSGETRLVDAAIQQFISDNSLSIEPGSTEWHELGHKLTRAEIDALERTLERDRGFFSGSPTDPIVRPAEAPIKASVPVSLQKLFQDYITNCQAVGKHHDGGKVWEPVFKSLGKFLGHDDARKITKRLLIEWRDSLLATGKSAATVSKKYLAAVRAVLTWAHVNDRLPTNEIKDVKQATPKKVFTRERGYTTPEAVRVLKASVAYMPPTAANRSNRESGHITAAKRWVPLLCAFTGARVTEMTQLRKEDVRRAEDCWILRITPDAGSVKTGQFRDVPLHRQVVALGFIDFVNSAEPGPLFHNAQSPDKYLKGARATAGRLSDWLQDQGLVPEGLQPSYGWRHRFKTQGRELGASDRVLIATQGHPGSTASDGYGDVTIAAILRVIEALSDYDLSDPSTAKGLAPLWIVSH